MLLLDRLVTDQASFAAATFAGLLGPILLAVDTVVAPMTILHVSHAESRRLLLVAFCALPLLPHPSAQTGKGLMADACYNELHRREEHGLWESQVERRNAGHVIREQEIETVDGPVHRLLSVDGHEPSPSERKQNDERLQELRQNPRARLELKKNSQADEKLLTDLLRVMPDAFLFEDQGTQESFEKLTFSPNPTYKPKTNEEKVLHAMSGVILIDRDEKRLARLSATLTQQVDFGYGIVGHLRKGGTVDVNRIQLARGIWKTSSFRIDIQGRFVFFKTISKQQDEAHSDFKSVAPDTTIPQALKQIGVK